MRRAGRGLRLLVLAVVLLAAAVGIWQGLAGGGKRGSSVLDTSSPRASGGAAAVTAEERAALPGEVAERSVAPREAGPSESAAAPAAIHHGRVVDGASGLGIEGALVGGRLALNSLLLKDPAQRGPLPPEVARTDREGTFVLAHLAAEVERLVALHDDYAPAAAERPAGGWSAETEIRIRAVQGPHVYGTVLDDAGEPAAGILIRVFGADWPRGVTAFTDAGGAYRTGAVHPGAIDVFATPGFGSSEKESGFTSETRSTVIGDTDLRVDFGPDAGLVVWRGRVLDEEQLPLESGELSLRALDPPGQADRTREQRRTISFAGGAFEAKKIRPGVDYSVSLSLAGEQLELSAGTLRFESAGTVEHDLLLAGHCLRGLVIDRDTGGPPERGGNAYVVRHGVEALGLLAKLDERGAFRLRGLDAASYDVYVHAPGYAPIDVHGIVVGEGAAQGPPVRIEVARGGRLIVRTRGLDPGLAFQLEFACEGSVRSTRGTATDARGDFEATYELAPGTWEVHMNAPGVGRASQSVPLPAGGEGEALFLPGDLQLFEGMVALEGRVLRADGTPVEGVRLYFYGIDSDLPEGEERLREARTDAEGSYRAVGFRPGRWSLSGVLPTGAELKFDDLVVPGRPPDPVRHDLYVSEGAVRARLVDERSGLALADEGPVWWAFLRDPELERTVAELQGGHRGARCELFGVPGGTYELLVMAQGYYDHTTPRFVVSEGDAHELGDIRLQPSAVLALEVVGPAGPVDVFQVAVAGLVLHAWEGYERTPGHARWDGLSSGTVEVAVEAKGYRALARSVRLEEGRVSEERFELVPE